MSVEHFDRLDWKDYHFSMAKVASARSTCPSRKVGCIIVDPASNFILATGYNGSPRGTEHCGAACKTRESGKNWEKCRAVHAELNAIVSAARSGQKLYGAHMYLTTAPCVFCSRVIIQAGIEHVFAMSYYTQPEAEELLNEGGVALTVYGGIPTPTIHYRKDEDG